MTRARCAATSPALREPAHVALGAALDERELRSAVGAGADEVPDAARPLAERPVRGHHPGARRRRRTFQQVLFTTNPLALLPQQTKASMRSALRPQELTNLPDTRSNAESYSSRRGARPDPQPIDAGSGQGGIGA